MLNYLSFAIKVNFYLFFIVYLLQQVMVLVALPVSLAVSGISSQEIQKILIGAWSVIAAIVPIYFAFKIPYKDAVIGDKLKLVPAALCAAIIHVLIKAGHMWFMNRPVESVDEENSLFLDMVFTFAVCCFAGRNYAPEPPRAKMSPLGTPLSPSPDHNPLPPQPQQTPQPPVQQPTPNNPQNLPPFL